MHRCNSNCESRARGDATGAGKEKKGKTGHRECAARMILSFIDRLSLRFTFNRYVEKCARQVCTFPESTWKHLSVVSR